MNVIPPPNARGAVRQFIRESVGDATEVYLPPMVDDAVAHFLNDASFVRSALAALLRPIVYEIAQAEITRSRGTGILLGDSVVDANGLDQRAQKLHTRWNGFYEYANGRYLKVLSMTADDLVDAADQREHRANVELAYARLWRALASKLNTGQTVGDRFKPEDLDRMYLDLTTGPVQLVGTTSN